MVERARPEDRTQGRTVRIVCKDMPPSKTRRAAKGDKRVETLASEEPVKGFPSCAMEHALKRHTRDYRIAASIRHNARCAKPFDFQCEIVREATPSSHRNLGSTAQRIAVARKQRATCRADIPASTVGISLDERVFRAKGITANGKTQQCQKFFHGEHYTINHRAPHDEIIRLAGRWLKNAPPNEQLTSWRRALPLRAWPGPQAWLRQA